MGSYAYCNTCQAGLNKPTAREIVEQVQFCREGHPNSPIDGRDDLLVELAARLDDLEERIAALEVTS